MKQLWHAIKLRCPNCGQGRMFFRWFKAFEHCGKCGFRYDRGEADYYIGAYTLNLIIAELLVVGAMVAGIIYWWPAVPWKALPWALVGPAVIGPFVTYPYSKSLWLAIDLLFRPVEPTDFVSPPDMP